MKEASRELLASRADVWAFLAEPYHLSDWWPGIFGVEPDRRGFSEGARWQVRTAQQSYGLLPSIGLRSGRQVSQVLLVTTVHPLERWAWRLVDPSGHFTKEQPAEIVLEQIEPERTRVTVGAGSAKIARAAVDRLYDLVQTAAEF